MPSRRRPKPRAKAVRVAVADRFRPRTDRAFVVRVVEATLAFAACEHLEVSLLMTDDREIARLHGEFLGDPTPTDVMAFPSDEGVDVVVSVERARREAERRGRTIRSELALYIVHGVLHACGYDDVAARDRARMRAAERLVLGRLRQRAAPVEGPPSRR